VERCALGPGSVHGADGWRGVGRGRPLLGTVKRLYFRGDAAFANPEMYEFLEAEGIGYAIRLPPNRVLEDKTGYVLKRLLGRPPHEVRRYHASFSYQTQSWKSRGEWWRRSNGIRVSFTRVSASSSPTTSLKEKLIKIPLRWSATAGRHVPNGGGRGATANVSGNPVAHRPAAGTTGTSMRSGGSQRR
jgi:hypothetical protein